MQSPLGDLLHLSTLCALIRARPLHASSGMQPCGPKSRRSGMTIGRFTVFAKPGGNCAAKVRLLPVAAWFGKRHRATISGAEAKP